MGLCMAWVYVLDFEDDERNEVNNDAARGQYIDTAVVAMI